MKSIITAGFNSGLGDMYTNLYQIIYLQEELKKIGYEVKTIIDLGINPYNVDGENRDIFKRIFKSILYLLIKGVVNLIVLNT